jgi:hypothetical protein
MERDLTVKRGVSSSLSYGGNLADLRLAEWNTKESCGFEFLQINNEKFWIYDLRSGTPKKFPDM